jgi:hypothetical protein
MEELIRQAPIEPKPLPEATSLTIEPVDELPILKPLRKPSIRKLGEERRVEFVEVKVERGPEKDETPEKLPPAAPPRERRPSVQAQTSTEKDSSIQVLRERRTSGPPPSIESPLAPIAEPSVPPPSDERLQRPASQERRPSSQVGGTSAPPPPPLTSGKSTVTGQTRTGWL